MEPLLKWVGGKRWHAPTVASLWDGQRRLVEPFCGGAGVTFALDPSRRALLNDANPHLMNFYQQVRDGLTFEISLTPSKQLYAEYRELFNHLASDGFAADTSLAAQLFYYLNRHGYCGLCRFNRAGRFNVPYRPTLRSRALRPTETTGWAPDLAPYRERLARWTLTCLDYTDVPLEPGDFVYADPPYDGAFDGYREARWTREDQKQLALWLAGHPGPVVLMNADNDWTRALYRSLGFEVTALVGQQKFHRSRGQRHEVREIMATKNVDDRDTMVVRGTE